MKYTYLVYFPLIISIYLVYLSATIYYSHRYTIRNSSTFNKYRLSPNNILIRLKLFKYNNDFNYFLLIPYLMICTPKVRQTFGGAYFYE